MIISRTPFRVSFFGGGTDLPTWYRDNDGAVLSTTIDKYCYISCRRLPPFFDYRHRIVYSAYEHVNGIDEIVHPAVRETFRFLDISEGVELHHDGDLPARSGLGSSSSFTVGLLHALYALKGTIVTKKRLAMESIHIEQNMIQENVGSQDQIAVAFGGLNKVTFNGDHRINVMPVTISSKRKAEFKDHLMLFFTGLTRFASDIERRKVENLKKNRETLRRTLGMVDDAIHMLGENGDLTLFGEMLNESWQIKKSLSRGVSTEVIDTIYDKALKSGAIGGKLLGAGGGGFFLFFVQPEKRDELQKSLAPLLHVPFQFDSSGSQIIFYSESGV